METSSIMILKKYWQELYIHLFLSVLRHNYLTWCSGIYRSEDYGTDSFICEALQTACNEFLHFILSFSKSVSS